MPESFHGHDLLELIGSRAEPWPLAEFRSAARAAFGEAPAFHNCHQGGFTLDSLLAFFAERGKVSLGPDSLSLGPVPRCNH